MSNLKNELIKLGATQPALRSHIRAIIASSSPLVPPAASYPYQPMADGNRNPPKGMQQVISMMEDQIKDSQRRIVNLEKEVVVRTKWQVNSGEHWMFIEMHREMILRMQDALAALATRPSQYRAR